MNPKDYYGILKVSKTATADEIKSAYRKLAKEYHPDTNKDPKAESKFKEINEAYTTLSDPAKKQVYDSGFSNPFTGQSSRKSAYPEDGTYWNVDYQDMFKDLFNDYYTQKATRATNSFDLDLNLELEISFMEAALGASKEIKFDKRFACNSCKGKGKTGQVQSCPTCKGRRTIKQTQDVKNIGKVVTNEICTFCKGSGVIQATSCIDCSHKGFIVEETSLTIAIPKGIETGQKLRLKNSGNSDGISQGDVYLHIIVNESHPIFKRDGKTIYSTSQVRLREILLGGEVSAETIHGPVKVKIPYGSQPNSKIKLAGQGILGGDHILELNLILPKKLSDYQTALIKDLDF